MKKLLIHYLALFPLFAFAEINPKAIDPSLTIVSQGFGYRVLVYSICSPEHCWSNSYLQNVTFGSENPEITCSVLLSEIEFGHSITNVKWEVEDGEPLAALQANASHGGFEPREVKLLPQRDCEYKISGMATTGY